MIRRCSPKKKISEAGKNLTKTGLGVKINREKNKIKWILKRDESWGTLMRAENMR